MKKIINRIIDVIKYELREAGKAANYAMRK